MGGSRPRWQEHLARKLLLRNQVQGFGSVSRKTGQRIAHLHRHLVLRRQVLLELEQQPAYRTEGGVEDPMLAKMKTREWGVFSSYLTFCSYFLSRNMHIFELLTLKPCNCV